MTLAPFGCKVGCAIHLNLTFTSLLTSTSHFPAPLAEHGGRVFFGRYISFSLWNSPLDSLRSSTLVTNSSSVDVFIPIPRTRLLSSIPHLFIPSYTLPARHCTIVAIKTYDFCCILEASLRRASSGAEPTPSCLSDFNFSSLLCSTDSFLFLIFSSLILYRHRLLLQFQTHYLTVST